MVTAVDESEVFTDDELVANPILVHIAGHETASGAACLALTTLQAISGEELVACALASLFETLARRGGGHVYIDGHVTDPHLQPVLGRIPREDANPVDLIEIG